ncbi:MAG: serine/threonine protein kinase [Labilithrix sp.]|nr:serine/threonine protein kinase [Labilithrix sp.]
MQTLPPDDFLPVLVADLADDGAREVLDAAALRGGRVWVPLETAPVNATAHVLEVHTPHAEPFFYIAHPLGPPTDDGFPLRIEPMPDAEVTHPRADTPRAAGEAADDGGVVRGRRSQTSMTLSESHTKDLSHVGPLPTEEGHDSKIGRALAGGKLVMEELIGRGGVGAVYKARHRELMMPVAVKVLHESFQSDIDFCRRFYAEALAASRLDHPNITRVIDFGQEPDGQLYFAMEYLDGVELRSVLESERQLDTTRIATVMMQVCAGLSHAHARGIVHRDIKPENLVLVPSQDDDGRPIEVVKVCDFGIALHRSVPAEDEGVVAGTPEYMSPEQCRSDELDARSDVYACGVVLYELATGQVPFIAERPAQLLNKHQYTPPLPPSKIEPSVDPRLEAIIMKALAKEPVDRQQSMRELRAALRELLDPIVVEASPAPPSMRELPSSDDFAAAPRGRLPTLPDEHGSGEMLATKAAPDAPAWLERGPVYASAHASQPGNVAAQPATAADPASDGLVQNTIAWTTRLAQTTDPKTFAQAAQKLEGAIRVLAQRGEVDALWRVSSTMGGVASEGSAAVGSRAWSATKLLRVFDDPAILVQIAEQLLNGPAEARDKARRLLVHGGVAGAYGLYGARVKLARIPAVRPLFVTVLKDFGSKAWPVVRASLEKIAATATPNAATLELAEDLLLCVPLVGDESAGHVVLKFLRWPHSGVCRAAAASIIKLWGERAKPLFVAMVQSKDDVVRVAGIAGLRQLRAVDEHLVPRLQAILTRRVPASEEVRAAAALALAHASATARQPAVSLLAQLLTPQRDQPTSEPNRTNGALSKQDAVVIAMARSLLAIGGKPYRGLVAERAERSPEPLRAQLRGLLTQSA